MHLTLFIYLFILTILIAINLSKTKITTKCKGEGGEGNIQREMTSFMIIYLGAKYQIIFRRLKSNLKKLKISFDI